MYSQIVKKISGKIDQYNYRLVDSGSFSFLSKEMFTTQDATVVDKDCIFQKRHRGGLEKLLKS